MKQRRLGAGGTVVSALGLGCAGMSAGYGVPDDAESIRTIHRAIDLGVTLFDTSDAYGAGRNETLLGEALEGRRSSIVLATKFGNIRGPNGERGGTNGRPEHVPKAVAASLERLRTDRIDLLYLHRVDPDVPIEETVGAMAREVEAGRVRYLGLCEAGEATIRRAHRTHPIAALQTEYSLWTRDVETGILPLVRSLDIGFVAYSPLGRGFLSGAIETRGDLVMNDRRHQHPRFQEGNFEANLGLLKGLRAVANAEGCSMAEIALAWLLAQGDDIVPIPGTKRRRYLERNVQAAERTLDARNVDSLGAAFPLGVANGLRYPEAQLRKLGI